MVQPFSIESIERYRVYTRACIVSRDQLLAPTLRNAITAGVFYYGL
jgi:hypothetical protein